jgi:hypothetical protein
MKPRLVLVLVLAAISAASVGLVAATRVQPGPVTYTAAADSIEIPFVMRTNHILVRGTVNDSDSLWFIVDTGAGSHVINRSTADRLKLEVTGGVHALGTGGRVEAGQAHDVTFHLAGLDLTAPLVAAIPLDGIGLQIGQDCDGIVGFPLFDHAIVTVDYDRSTLVIRQPERFKSKAPSLKLSFVENHPYVDAAVTLTGGKPIEGRFVLDTGSGLALVLNSGFVAKHEGIATAGPTITGRLGGVGGHAFHPFGRIERLTLGPYALERPITVFSNPGPGRTSVDNSIGNIGGEVLQRFRVTFDYPHKRLYLEPGAMIARPFEADMTGMMVVVEPEGAHEITVIGVQKDSPAAALGIATGDILETVDGQPLTSRNLPEFRQRMRAENEQMRLGLKRGATRTEVTLQTRRQI